MDHNESPMHTHSLFPLHATELFPEHSSTTYSDTLHHLSSHGHVEQSAYQLTFGMPWWNTVSHESTPLCPRCSAPGSGNANWCTACGELLLGAGLCSSDLNDWNLNGASFHSIQVSQNTPVSTEWCTTGGSQQPSGYMAPYLPSYPQRALSAVALNPSFGAASFTMVSSFSAPFSCTSAIDNDEFLSLAQQTNPAYHVAETNVPSSNSQVEALQSALDELHLRTDPLVSMGSSGYISTAVQEHATSFPDGFCRGSLRTASSYPDSVKDGVYLGHQPSRQRCISGPVQHPMMAAERRCLPEPYHFDYVPLMYQLGDCVSPLLSNYGSQVQQLSPSMQNSWYIPERQHQPSSIGSCVSTNQQCVIGLPRTQTIKRVPSDRNDGINIDCSRRKHQSECSASQLYSTQVNGDSPNKSVSRSRSFSSELRFRAQKHSKMEKCHFTKPNWQSSRTAWSSHCPSSLKKKPADYLRASYSQICSTHKQNHHPKPYLHPVASGADAVPTHKNRSKLAHSSVEQGQQHTGSTVSATWPITQGLDEWTVKSRRRTRQRIPRHATSDCGITPVPNTGDCVEASRVTMKDSQFHSTVQEVQGDSISPVPVKCLPNWMLLPNELWLRVIGYLPWPDRAHLALVCCRLSNLVVDPCLWRVVQLNRCQHLTDTSLASIGRLRPRELHFFYCHGDSIATAGLRQLFKGCGPSLHKLSFVGCTKGLFDCDHTLLLAAEHCPNLQYVDASYTLAVTDRTVIELAKSTRELISVKLNGAQQISISAIQQLVHYHQRTLQRLELFGCFRLNSNIFTVLSRCQQLRALAFGHLHHLSSKGLLELVGKLPLLASLDLRGTQTLANDTNLPHLADKCPHLEEVVLANMHSLKHEAGVAQMLRRLPRLRVLDLCGLAAVGDLTMEAVANGCPQLEHLDVSCTSVTHKGLFCLIRSPAKCLRCLRISHHCDITKDVLTKLVEACSKLISIHAYGFKSIKDWSFLREIRPTLLVESDN